MQNLVNITPGTLYYQTRWDFLGITADPSVWNNGWSWRDEESTAKIQKSGNEVAARLLSVLVSLTHIELGKRVEPPTTTPEVGPWLTQSSKFLNRWLLGNNKAPQTIRRAMTLLRRLGLVEAQKPKEASRTPYRYRVVLREVNRAVQYFSGCMVVQQQAVDEDDDGNDAYFPLSDRPSYPIPPGSVTPNSPPVAPSYAPVARSCNSDEYSYTQGAPSLNTNKFIPINDLSNKQVIKRDPEADFLSPEPDDEIQFSESDSLANNTGDGFTVNAEILDDSSSSRAKDDRPAPPPPILKKDRTPPGNINDDFQSGAFFYRLERYGLADIHDGGDTNNWSDGIVNAVIAKMAIHDLHWDDGAAREHLNSKMRASDFATLKLYRNRMMKMAADEEESRQYVTVANSPHTAEYLRQHPQQAEGLSEWDRWLLEGAS